MPALAIISLQSEKRETNDRNLPEGSERDCAFTYRSLWENFNLESGDLYLHAKVPVYLLQNEINERHV